MEMFLLVFFYSLKIVLLVLNLQNDQKTSKIVKKKYEQNE